MNDSILATFQTEFARTSLALVATVKATAAAGGLKGAYCKKMKMKYKKIHTFFSFWLKNTRN